MASAHDSPQPATDARAALAAPPLLRILRRRWKIVLACAVITAAAAYGIALTQPTAYTASAALLFRNSTLDQQVSGTTLFAPSIDPTRDASTNLTLVSLNTISGLTAKALHNGLTAGDVQSRITVASEGQSNVVSVSATDANPRLAARLANTYAQQYITFNASSDRAKITAARNLVQGQFNALTPALQASGQGQTLASRAEQLRILANLQTGNANLVQAAGVPSAPSSPQPRRDALIGALLGLILGLSLALLAEKLDRSLHSVDELVEVYELPLLAVIPRDSTLPRAPREFHPASSEPFQLLRSRLRYFNVDRHLRTILVASSDAAEGKTTVAWNLAVAAALAGQSKVLLIETDLRRPTLAGWLGLPSFPGLAEVITHGITASAAIQTVRIDSSDMSEPPAASSNGDMPSHAVDVLLAGVMPPNPTELLESNEMHRVLALLTAIYDQIVIDTAPMGLVSDAIPLIPLADGMVVVSRLGKNSRDAARHMRAQLRHLGAPVLGVIANDVKSSTDGYYGYSSDAPQIRESQTSDEAGKAESLA